MTADAPIRDALGKFLCSTLFPAANYVRGGYCDQLAGNILAAFPTLRAPEPIDREALANIIGSYIGCADGATCGIVADAILAAFSGKLQLRRMPTLDDLAAICGSEGSQWDKARAVLALLSELAAPVVEIDELALSNRIRIALRRPRQPGMELPEHIAAHEAIDYVRECTNVASGTRLYFTDKSANIKVPPGPARDDVSQCVPAKQMQTAEQPMCLICQDTGRVLVRCPENKPGCLVCHWGPCPDCQKARSPSDDTIRKKAEKLRITMCTGTIDTGWSYISPYLWELLARHVEAEVRAAQRETLVLAATAIFELPGIEQKGAEMHRACHTAVCNLIAALDAETPK